MAQQPLIVTDSAADLPPEVVEALGITVIPLNLHLNSQIYRDGVDISCDDLFSKARNAQAIPSLSAPAVKKFYQTYSKLGQQAEEIISIHHSSRLSLTVERAQQAAISMVGQSRVMVVDSLLTTVGLGMLVVAAAEAARAGESADSILRLLRDMISHIYLVLFVESLGYLERDGRIREAQSILGTMLNIKPLLIMEDGEIEPMEKVRTRSRGLDKLAEFVSEFTRIERLVIIHKQGIPKEIQGVIERVDAVKPGVPIEIANYGSALATHVGMDALGIVIYEGQTGPELW
ncbi:MAG: DegV family protein [Chloroflexi bacterium]|nr:DegV family protein [Chloroflexota bacterium]